MSTFSFNVNWLKHIKHLLPFGRRTAFNLAWLKLLSFTQIRLHSDFLNYRKQLRYDISFNGQTIYLEKLLNDLYDPGLRRIYIVTLNDIGVQDYVFNKIESKPPQYIYNKSEGKPQFFIYQKAELPGNTDFQVYVPNTTTSSQLIGIRTMLNKYKLASKRYLIISFNPLVPGYAGPGLAPTE